VPCFLSRTDIFFDAPPFTRMTLRRAECFNLFCIGFDFDHFLVHLFSLLSLSFFACLSFLNLQSYADTVGDVEAARQVGSTGGRAFVFFSVFDLNLFFDVVTITTTVLPLSFFLLFFWGGRYHFQVVEEYMAINDEESRELARAFLGPKFLQGQRDFLNSKGKKLPAAVFQALLLTRPVWSRFLDEDSDVLRHVR